MATELVQDREMALKVGYVSTDWGIRPSYGLYKDLMTDWEVRLIVRDGQAIGTAYTRGTEFHVSIRPEWRGRWVTRGLLRELIARPLSMTRVSAGHEHLYGVIERLGFEHQGDGLFVRDLSNGH